jgi:flagellum-specific ATP synthase
VRAQGGSLTALYTVLVEGDDVEDPIADNVRAILDGHILLSRDIAQRGRFPAVDISRSVSRLSATVATSNDHRTARATLELIALFESSRDLIEVGAYRAGNNPALDRAVRVMPALEKFLAQGPQDFEQRDSALAKLRQLLDIKGTDHGSTAAT